MLGEEKGRKHEGFNTYKKQVKQLIGLAISECPECTFHIKLPPDMQEGDVMQCPDCSAMIRLVKIYPPLFELVEE